MKLISLATIRYSQEVHFFVCPFLKSFHPSKQ